jgi:hypothetical protein
VALPQNTKVQILKRNPAAQWYAVVTGDGNLGYIAEWLLWRHLREDHIDIHLIKKGETPLSITRNHYGPHFNRRGKICASWSMHTRMYDPPKFLTVELLSALLEEFTWPEEYTLEDELPDGIFMVFPACNLLFTEGFESEMGLQLVPADTGLDHNVTLAHALQVLRARPGAPPRPTLINHVSPAASLDKVKNGVRDLCTLALAYLGPCIRGDFSWVKELPGQR